MAEIDHPCKVISICSNIVVHGKAGYAVNFAAALAKVTGAPVLLIDMARHGRDILKLLKLDGDTLGNAAINSEIGIDILNLENIRKQRLEQIKSDYKYVVIDLPVEIDESVYEIFSWSDSIHFFVDSTKDNLKNGYLFLKDLLGKGLGDIRNKLKAVVSRLNIFDRFSTEEMSWLLKRNVWTVVPEPGILDALIDSKGIPLVLRSPDSEYTKAVMRITKSETGKLLGLALGSGAAFGLAHIGVLRVLEQNHIPIDVVSGSSMGALIAALWGLGFSSDKIEYIARKLRSKLNIMRLLDFTIPISGILAGKRLRRFLKSILGQKTFEDLQIPVKIMVYDLANRETLVVEKGLLVEAVYTSVAVPGIFRPKMEKGRMIVDGGISDPVPVDISLKQGVKKIIAVNVLPSPEDIYKRNMLLKKRLKEEENMIRTSPFYIRLGLIVKDYFRRVFTPNIFDVIMTSMQSIEYILAEDSCKKAGVVLHPVFADATSIDFHLVKDFIKKAEEETMSNIEKIKKLALQ